MDERRFEITQVSDAVWIAERAIELARACGLVERSCWAVGIAASELATNVARHAGTGTMTLRRAGDVLEVIAEDGGPGIPDPERAAEDGYTTASSGLGSGLGAVRRLMDDLAIEAIPGGGTRVVARMRIQV